METKVYDQKGKEIKKIKLSDELWALPWNDDLVHQVMVSLQSNQRSNTAHSKDRGAVRGGGKKPWRQKGTGRARHGSNRSPIWRGGGVTFGPLNLRNWTKKINKKVKRKALLIVLSEKLRDGEILFVDEFKFTAPQTKEAKVILQQLSTVKGFEGMFAKKRNAVFVAVGERDENVEKSFANFSNVGLQEFRNLNILDLLRYKYLVITQPEKCLEFLAGGMGNLSEGEKKTDNSREEIDDNKDTENLQTNSRTERIKKG